MSGDKRELDRRQFLRESTAAAAAFTTALRTMPARADRKKSGSAKKMIVLGFDGMEPSLTEQMMESGDLPNLDRLRQDGGYRRLATSIPPQTVVAFASFITGVNPGGHGIFDFIHRNPAKQYTPMFAGAGVSRGAGYWEVGEHKLQLTFWPFNHSAAEPVLYREGVPFWDYLDAAGVPTHIYEVPANFPPSKSRHGHHRALAGMGTPDMRGDYGTYQYFAEDGPFRPQDEGGGIHSRIVFKNDSAQVELAGPMNTFLKRPVPTTVAVDVYRDPASDACLLEFQGQRILLKPGQWSRWVRLEFRFAMPSFVPDEYQSGICKFYLQEVSPNYRLYVTPINIDPAHPAIPISEPPQFVTEISKELGMFYTATFHEDNKALTHKVFTDEEYVKQTDMVLEERMEMLEYALSHYDDGMLFFYFACTDLQPHMFFWDSDEKHPVRSFEDAQKYHGHIKELYRKMDKIVGDLLDRYGDDMTLIAMSDHGMSHFKRQFNLCTWLRDNGYIKPIYCTSLTRNVDWSRTRAYGLGLNGLYLNLKGRERDGIVDSGTERESLLAELIEKLEAVRDVDGKPVIRKVYRGDEVYSGEAMKFAPDLIIGYHRGYRCSWDTSLGEMTEEAISDNTEAWSADHCLAAEDVPGVLFSNRPIRSESPSLLDLAPTILAEYGVDKPSFMVGHSIFDQLKAV